MGDKCKKCGKDISKHNLYLHEGMCDDCWFDDSSEDAEVKAEEFSPDYFKLLDIFDGKGTGLTQISEDSIQTFIPLLAAIEEPIVYHYKNDNSLGDQEVLNSLKKIRDHLSSEKSDYNELESSIIQRVKVAVLFNKYSRRDASLAFSRIIRSLKNHKTEGGKRGYLDFIQEQFSKMESEDDPYEDSIEFEGLSFEEKYEYLLESDDDDDIDLDIELLNFGSDLEKKGEFEKAKRIYYHGRRNFLEDFAFGECLGMLYKKEGNYAFAEPHLKRSLELAQKSLKKHPGCISPETIDNIKKSLEQVKKERALDNGEIISLVEKLTMFDNEEGYKLKREKVREKIQATIKKITGYKEECLEYVHPLLFQEETWSCEFALDIIREIKSEKSIPALIEYIEYADGGDFWEGCEDAMKALISIGNLAVKPLLGKIRSNFEGEIYLPFLVGSLTGIKSDEVYSFMLGILKDYMENVEKYKGWFDIDDFTYDFDVQGKKEILPLLKELSEMEHLSRMERREIKSTIGAMEDPEGFAKKVEEMAQKLLPKIA